MSFDLPRGRIIPVDELDIRLDPAPHPFLAGKEEAVAANWRAEQERKPALFDGEVVLLSRLSYRAGRLDGRCHRVRYSEFLYWRSQRPLADAEHAYANAVLVAADGALIAIRMAPHTFNGGLVYFAAGSFEPGDFPGGHVDIHSNMRREVLEETGIDLGQCRAEPGFHALSLPTGTVLFRRYFAGRPADALAEAIRRHIGEGSEDEIEDVVILRPGEALPTPIAAHMPPLVEWHFARAESEVWALRRP